MNGKLAKKIRAQARIETTSHERFSGEIVVAGWVSHIRDGETTTRKPSRYHPCRHATGTYRNVLRKLKRSA